MWCSSCACPPCPACVSTCGSWVVLMCVSLAVTADQVKQWEQEDPDDVDKVPVQSEVLHERNVPRRVGSGLRSENHVSQQADADNHVQRVHAGHGEIETEVHLSVPRHVQRKRFVACRLRRLIAV